MSGKSKTIEIDDSGTGDLVGNAFIALHLINTGEIIFKTVPVKLYREENLKKNSPKKKILELVKQGLKELNFNKETDTIKLCRGDCFDLVRIYFKGEGINYEPTLIEGKLQDAVEGKLVSHLKKLGVRSKKLSIKSGVERYFILFNWVCRDFPNREKYVKTGFKKWKTVWRERAIINYNKYKKSKGKVS